MFLCNLLVAARHFEWQVVWRSGGGSESVSNKLEIGKASGVD